jgi:hypothetical protein
MAGRLNLSMLLLYQLAKAGGAQGDVEIQRKANEILCELSLRLPE